jgi:hypothetical protein
VIEFAKNTMVGLLSSCRHTLNTVTVKLQVAVLPDASVAVQVTVVVPTGKHDPDGGLHATVTPGQLSLAVGGAKVTTTHGSLIVAVLAVMLAGQVIEGGCVSLTVTVNVQPTPAWLLHVTVVVPTGKNEPDKGVHETVPQSPAGVGAG